MSDVPLLRVRLRGRSGGRPQELRVGSARELGISATYRLHRAYVPSKLVQLRSATSVLSARMTSCHLTRYFPLLSELMKWGTITSSASN